MQIIVRPATGCHIASGPRLAGMILPRDEQGNTMTHLNNEAFELSVEELDQVSAGDLSTLQQQRMQMVTDSYTQVMELISNAFKTIAGAQNQVLQNIKN
jgi:hypothetical protein